MTMSRLFSVAAVMLVATSVSFADGGSIKGKVTFKGGREALKDEHKRTVISTSADANCTKKIGSYAMIVQKSADGSGMENVMVQIKNAPKAASPGEPKLLDQQGCEYTPHVTTITVGQTLTIRNSDPTTHNINSLSKVNEPFNFSQPKPGMTKDVVFTAHEFFKIKCDVHPWMASYIGVFDHAHHTSTDKDGNFEIKNVPDGEWELEFWHEELGGKTLKVTVKDGAATADFEYSYE